jgi:hypothetical protein
MDAEDARLHKLLERDMYRIRGERRIRPTPISKRRVVEKDDEPSVFDSLFVDSDKDDEMIGNEADSENSDAEHY